MMAGGTPMPMETLIWGKLACNGLEHSCLVMIYHTMWGLPNLRNPYYTMVLSMTIVKLELIAPTQLSLGGTTLGKKNGDFFREKKGLIFWDLTEQNEELTITISNVKHGFGWGKVEIVDTYTHTYIYIHTYDIIWYYNVLVSWIVV